MFEFNKYINFIDGVLPKINLSSQKRQELTDLRNKVVDRYNDPNLYLSMLSDFSAGKSTIINKLIGKNLLKTARQATTSVPTYIRNSSGSETVITVKTVYGDSYNLSDRHQLRFFERLIGMELPKEEWKIISMLTTDEVYVRQKNDIIFKLVDKVTVEIPYNSGIENLCIIDTPGVNPGGGDNTVQHAERTKQILKDVADCALILFPGHQSYTRGFQEFLDDNAREFISDAVFVVTQMDIIDEEERDEVLRETKANLEAHFGIRDTNFLHCAAGKAGRDEYWTKQFEEFKDALYKHLRERREQIINRNLADLLKKLLEAINTEMNADNEDLKNKLSVLAENSVPNLTTVLDRITEEGKSKVTECTEAYRKELDDIAKSLPDSIKSGINSNLYDCKKRSEVTNFAKNELSDVVVRRCKPLEDSVKKSEETINNVYKGIRKTMTDTMVSYYGRISQLNGEGGTLKVDNSLKKINSELSGKLSGIDADVSVAVDIAAVAGGGIIAAAVLTALGPVGWIIGGIAGLFGGDYLFVDTARDKVRDAVYPKVPSIVSDAKQETKKNLNNFKQNTIKQIDNYKQELLKKYEEVYKKLNDSFNSERSQLVSRLQTNAFLIKHTNLLLAELNQI